MSLGSGIYTRLSGATSAGDRVYPGRLPQDVTLPAIAWQMIPSAGPLYVHGADAGVTTVRVQFDCWGATYDDAETVADELRSSISGDSGYWDDVHVGHCLLDSGGFDEDDEKVGTYRRSVDAIIQYAGPPEGS